MMYRIAILVLLLSGCAHTDEWTKRDAVMQTGVTVLAAYDGYLTAQLHTYPGITEGGNIARRIIGRNPDASDAYMYMGTLIVSSYFISRALPAKWRPYWQVAHMGSHGHGINAHCNDGLC